jgi:hypothetical protein
MTTYKILDLFQTWGMTERSAKTFRTRLHNAKQTQPKEVYEFTELEDLLSGCTGKYAETARKFLFTEKAKTYNAEIKKVTLIELPTEQKPVASYKPKIFDLVWIGTGEDRKKGVIDRTVTGSYADVVFIDGALAGQTAKVSVESLSRRCRGE